MKPTVTYEITDELTAIAFNKAGFPLSTVKPPKIDFYQ